MTSSDATNSIKNPPSRLLLKNAISLSTSGVIERLLGMIAGVFVRRALGPGPIGLINWTLAIATYPALLIQSGLVVLAKRDIARGSRSVEAFTGLILGLQLLIALLSGIGMVLLAFVIDRPQAVKYLLAIQVINLLLLPFDFTWLLHAKEIMTPLAVATLVNTLAQTSTIIFLIHGPEDLYLYAIISYPFRLFLTFYQVFLAHHNKIIEWRNVRLTLNDGWKLFRESLPIGLSSLSIMLYYNSDTLILGATRSAEEVGLYTTAYSLMLVSGLITGALINTFFPSLARAAADDEAARIISNQYLRVLIWIGFPLAALGWAIGRYPVILLYGNEFTLAGLYFEWLCVNIAAIFFNVGYIQPLYAWGGEKQLFIATLITGIVNLAANLVLIPVFGVPAAIGTTIFAEIMMSIIGYFIRRRFFPISFIKHVFISGMLCALIAFVTRGAAQITNWWLAGIFGTALLITGILVIEKETLLLLKASLFNQEIPFQDPHSED